MDALNAIPIPLIEVLLQRGGEYEELCKEAKDVEVESAEATIAKKPLRRGEVKSNGDYTDN